MFSPASAIKTWRVGFAILLLGAAGISQSNTGSGSSQPASPSAGTNREGTRVAPLNQSTKPATPSVPQQPAAQMIGNPEEIRLDGGDLINVSVFGAPEMSDDQRISESGDIYLPLVGSIHVQDLLPEAAQQAIEDKLRDGGYLRDPHVSVFVKEYATAGISVTGEVAKPGIYPLIGTHHLFDVVSAAGGTTPQAGTGITIVHHSDPDHGQHVAIEGDMAESNSANVEVYPGDTVVVSKAGIVYVVGDVKVPGGYVMQHNNTVTAMQALSLAQGNNPGAALRAAKIVRKGPDGVKEIPVDLAQIEKAKLPDVAMQNDDVLFIPTSTGKNVATRSASSILQIATGLLIYHPF